MTTESAATTDPKSKPHQTPGGGMSEDETKTLSLKPWVTTLTATINSQLYSFEVQAVPTRYSKLSQEKFDKYCKKIFNKSKIATEDTIGMKWLHVLFVLPHYTVQYVRFRLIDNKIDLSSGEPWPWESGLSSSTHECDDNGRRSLSLKTQYFNLFFIPLANVYTEEKKGSLQKAPQKTPAPKAVTTRNKSHAWKKFRTFVSSQKSLIVHTLLAILLLVAVLLSILAPAALAALGPLGATVKVISVSSHITSIITWLGVALLGTGILVGIVTLCSRYKESNDRNNLHNNNDDESSYANLGTVTGQHFHPSSSSLQPFPPSKQPLVQTELPELPQDQPETPNENQEDDENNEQGYIV